MSNSSSETRHGPAFERAKAAHEAWTKLGDKLTPEAKELQRAFESWTTESKAHEDALNAIGRRYAEATFDSYRITSRAQQRVVDSLREYASNATTNINAGRNVILLGPKGTGKDHLLVALAKACFAESGIATRWINGIDLLNEFHHDAINPRKESRFDRDPREVAPVLYISDPLPPTGALTESKLAAMFRLIDSRYRAMRPTWVSLNVADGAEAEARLGGQSVDRLRHGALILVCGWDSYRKDGS